MRLFTLLALSLLVGGCMVSTRNVCEGDPASSPDECRRCESDADCVFMGNPCEGVVFCAHREVPLVSTDLGCEPEPSLPGDDGCVCRDSYCQTR